jgi:starvation-inducible outer membrane lipoprotein
MRIIGLFAMCLWLGACTTTPLFPPQIIKDVETDTFVLKAWKEQTSYPSGAHFVSHKVELGGQIAQVIRKRDGVVILAKVQPVNKYLGYGPTSVRREGSFEFAIVLNGSPDADMLQAGNQLAVVGVMDSSSPEVIGGMPRVLPHLLAQCLHIWKTNGFENDFVPWEGSMGYYPLEKRTFCRKEGKEGTLSTSNDQGDETKGSTGS